MRDTADIAVEAQHETTTGSRIAMARCSDELETRWGSAPAAQAALYAAGPAPTAYVRLCSDAHYMTQT